MATESKAGKEPRYLDVTRSATYGFWAALPLLLFYEVAIVVANPGPVQVRVGADVWMKQLLLLVGANGMLALGVVVILIGAAVLYLDRGRNLPIRLTYFGGILGESLVYGVVVAVIVSQIVYLVAPAPLMIQAAPLDLFSEIALSVGAGLYEELVFRVLLVGGLAALGGLVFESRSAAYVLAALLGALIFSAVHYFGTFGDVFTIPSFLFRFLFGLALNAIFLVRGFGVAAWTHALYDIMVVTDLL